MFKRLRIAALLYILLFVAAAEYFTARNTNDWDATLWVDIYTVAGDGSTATRRYLDRLRPNEFGETESFLNGEAERYGVALDQPFKLRVVGEHRAPLPELSASPSRLDVLWWSLRMRFLAARLGWQSDGPTGDIIVFAVFHEPSAGVALDRSTALRKGLIAVSNLFADDASRSTNQIVLAHELLHTLRATDKYSLESNMPRHPDGYAAPDARPLLPQTKAEIMAGRIPLDAAHAEMPRHLRDVVIGPATAREIGWQATSGLTR